MLSVCSKSSLRKTGPIWSLKTGWRDPKGSVAPALREWKLQLPVNEDILSDCSRDKRITEGLWLVEQVPQSEAWVYIWALLLSSPVLWTSHGNSLNFCIYACKASIVVHIPHPAVILQAKELRSLLTKLGTHWHGNKTRSIRTWGYVWPLCYPSLVTVSLFIAEICICLRTRCRYKPCWAGWRIYSR